MELNQVHTSYKDAALTDELQGLTSTILADQVWHVKRKRILQQLFSIEIECIITPAQQEPIENVETPFVSYIRWNNLLDKKQLL